MTDWNELPEQLQLQLTSSAVRTAALMLASLADALAEELDLTHTPDPSGRSALRRLADEVQNPMTSDWVAAGHA